MLKISEKLMVRAADPDEIYSLSDEELDRAAAAEIERLTAENERLRGLPAILRRKFREKIGSGSICDEFDRDKYEAALSDLEVLINQQSGSK